MTRYRLRGLKAQVAVERRQAEHSPDAVAYYVANYKKYATDWTDNMLKYDVLRALESETPTRRLNAAAGS
jgi:hypothetical protein